MNKTMITLFFLVLLAAAGYHCYQQGYFNQELDQVENTLTENCNLAEEDCLDLEEDLAI